MKEVKKEVKNELNYSSLSALKGLYVTTKEEGKMLGKVTDIFLNTDSKKLAGFFVKHDFWNKVGLYVPIGEIETFGEEVIQIKSLHWCEKVKEVDSRLGSSLHKIRGHRITTQDGTYLGEFLDANFNSQTWEISELFISGDKTLKVESNDVAIGSDEIIVPSTYSTRIKKREHEHAGILRIFFGEDKMDSVIKIFEKDSKKAPNEDSTKNVH